ncbi:GNAT family N-acetyltransferase [uncultured Lentibacter sp.]|uniref:GNAT family N-acetyltransferase n=1 Tax=uncultured Lentibacter sp. TaxID=1659309 RepID=UPI002612F3EA|nr:GNAT family N-acetyltransferase [uncultured Lentibacter sp.]
MTLANIHLTFGTTPLLEGAALSVMPRERLCLVGRNGSGKSTLLKIAAGMVEQDKGERFVKPGTTVRYLPQEPDLSAFDRARDYIEAGLVGADDGYRVPYLLDALGLTGDEDPKVMSGGEQRRAALAPLLAGSPHGMIYLIGPRNAPVGYIVITLGYSIELGGIEGFIDEFFIREKVRGRGMGSETLSKLLPALKNHGVKALHLEVARDNGRAQSLYRRAGFEPRETYMLMTRSR